jgi:hypothetical protein
MGESDHQSHLGADGPNIVPHDAMRGNELDRSFHIGACRLPLHLTHAGITAQHTRHDDGI